MYFLFGNKFVFVCLLATVTAVSVQTGYVLATLFVSGGSVEAIAVAVAVFIPAVSCLPALFRVRHEVVSDVTVNRGVL